MNKTEVLLRTHRFLKSQPLGQQDVLRLFTDAYSTLLAHKALAPFQRFTLDMGDFVMHPDLVGQLNDGETIFAIEAKGDTDLLKGLAQAEMYQSGFHYAFLAADAGALGTSLVEFARRKDIGVIAVSDEVAIPYFPVARMPLRVPFQSILRQIATVIQVSQGETFHFNIPTHYLVWPIALAPNVAYFLDAVLVELKGYPMPAEWRQALSGAQKLGLVRLLGNSVQLTTVGSAIKAILPSSVEEWTQVHKQVGTRGHSVPLVQCQPQAAAVLRLLLLQDDLVQLVIEGLESFPIERRVFRPWPLPATSLTVHVRLSFSLSRVRWHYLKMPRGISIGSWPKVSTIDRELSTSTRAFSNMQAS
jgi:hypothetical protein